jgi:hypothetical protein
MHKNVTTTFLMGCVPIFLSYFSLKKGSDLSFMQCRKQRPGKSLNVPENLLEHDILRSQFGTSSLEKK